LTSPMKNIQNSLLIAIDTCLNEIKKACPQLTHSMSYSVTAGNHINHTGVSVETVKDALLTEDTTSNGPGYLTVENALFHSFDSLLKRSLEADWYKLSYRTKDLISDITTLRKLLDYLIRYDAFSFYYYLEQLHITSSEQTYPSLW
jgi:DNA excision repair protein ERCC-4